MILGFCVGPVILDIIGYELFSLGVGAAVVAAVLNHTRLVLGLTLTMAVVRAVLGYPAVDLMAVHLMILQIQWCLVHCLVDHVMLM